MLCVCGRGGVGVGGIVGRGREREVTHMLSHTGLRCRVHAVDLKSKETALETGFFSGIGSWRNSTVGEHPWQVGITKTLIS